MSVLVDKKGEALAGLIPNEIKSGFASYTVAAGSVTTISVVFDNPYPAGTSYAVTVSQSGTYAFSNVFLGSKDRTVNGFTINVSSERSAELSSQVMWVAVPVRT